LLVGSLQNSSSDLLISAEIADKDIIFRGIDGSSTIDALKLDMSESGNATFTGTVTSGELLSSVGLKVAGHPVVGYASFDGGYATRLGSTGSSTLNATQIYAGGSVQATFKGNKAGIGTTNPSTPLHVVGNNGILVDTSGNGDGQIYFGGISGSDRSYLSRSINDFAIWNVSNGIIKFATNDAEVMRIDSSGNVGIGTTNGDVTNDGTAARTYVGIIGTGNRGRLNIGSTASNGADAGTLAFTNGANTLADINVDTTAGVQNTGTMYINGTRSIKIQAAASDEVVFNESGTDVDFRVESNVNAGTMFIEGSSGVVNFGRASSSINTNGAYILGGEIIASMPASTNTYLLRNTATAAYTFYVSSAGQISAVQTSISSLSDERLKENIVDIDTGLDEVMALKPRKFDWKEGEGSSEKNVSGFVAQEVETVLPNLIGSFKHDDLDDAKSVKMGDMVPTLVKAIQEQQELIKSLEDRIASLEP
jgi:hypothetical protein